MPAAMAGSRINDEYLRLLIDSVRDYALFVLDASGRVVTWNPGAQRLKGYTADEIIGSDYERFFTPEDAAAGRPAAILARARRDGACQDEGWRLRKDGTRFWASAVITALHDPSGALRGYAKVTRDDTDRHAAIEALRGSEERFRLLVGGLKQHALYMLDPDGRVASWNDGAFNIKGYKATEIIGKHFSVFFTADERAAGRPMRLLDIARRMGSYEEEGWRVRKDGSRFWATVVVTALHNAAGELTGFAKVTRDESLRHRTGVELQEALERATKAEEELRRHTSELEARVAERTQLLSRQSEVLAAANAELEQFAYVASHDLQEPLRLISMNLDLLQRLEGGKLQGQSQRCVVSAIEGAERMRQLIDSLLAFSRIDHAPTIADPVDLEAALSDALANLEPAIRARQALIERSALPTVRADRTLMTQALQNLLSNALKFNESAQPRVAIGARREGERWIVTVADNGIGIEARYLERIFAPFHRLHDRSRYEGNGVGLAIVRKAVERYGGSVQVESTPGSGSRFMLTLPAA
jgi:PAS domain S-box-containing protein